MKRSHDKTMSLTKELGELKVRYGQLDSKCAQLTADRLKYVNLCTQLTQENKKLYKKWFNSRRTANSKSVLVERLRRSVVQKETKTATVKQKNKEKKSSLEEEKSTAMVELAEAISSSKQLETRVRQLSDELKSMKTRNETLTSEKLELDAKLAELSDENGRLKREMGQIEQKVKSLKTQNDNLLDETKRKETELREKEKSNEKQEEHARDELRKGI